MEEELVGELFPKDDGSTLNLRTPYAYTKYFRETLPYMMVMGMTPDEFWDGDPDLAFAYRQAWEIRQDTEFKIRNEYAWINNMYTYGTMVKVAPLFSSFADSKTKYGEYFDKPFDFDQDAETEEEAYEKDRQRKLARIRAMVETTNQRFKEKEKT